MLYNFDWLKPNKSFPPDREKGRISRYIQNASLFDGEHFADSVVGSDTKVNMYAECVRRISRVVGNFSEVISFPVLLNYQRLMTLKMADLVCGEYPTITGSTFEENKKVQEIRERTDFDSKLYSSVIDISRYGEAVIRIYRSEQDDQATFTLWDPTNWFPIVSQDGTRTILYHCICWKENLSKDFYNPIWRLHVQIHGTSKEDWGKYKYMVFKMDSLGLTIGKCLKEEVVNTGLNCCAVMNLKAFEVSNTVYGYDDYMTLDSLLSEIMTRIGQISAILDKHADPNITGPTSMLTVDPETGERYLAHGKFFAINQGDTPPSYMVWDGQLTAAFKELEIMINQLYILSEMGAALLGSTEGSGQAISGTAMRFKMTNPLAKARRISNALTNNVKKLFSALSMGNLDAGNISIEWEDGLPDDPRENIENAKLATGATKMMPLERAIVEFFNRSADEARTWVEELGTADEEDPNKPGPQDGTGVNPQAHGSETGLQSFKSDSNKTAD